MYLDLPCSLTVKPECPRNHAPLSVRSGAGHGLRIACKPAAKKYVQSVNDSVRNELHTCK